MTGTYVTSEVGFLQVYLCSRCYQMCYVVIAFGNCGLARRVESNFERKLLARFLASSLSGTCAVALCTRIQQSQMSAKRDHESVLSKCIW